jgi:hypothetical protein
MSDKIDGLAHQDFTDKVILPDCLIKIYMDYTGLDKEEAERRI